MSEQPPSTEFLVISRGQWDSTLSRKEKQNVIDRFYTWLDQLVHEGKMKRGQRLKYEGKTIGRKSAITDGPFGESKEVIGGYWFVLAHSLDEAVQIAKTNPCLDHGLFVEIRPIDPQFATPDNTR
ncbi:MAG TPA: YciI family protein [Chthoniobacterales bacterium]|nr:YciI family protein [Chthoniobacterales bacterium]